MSVNKKNNSDMKIYKNKRGEIVFDGDGITTIKIPKSTQEKSVSELIESRINIEEQVLITRCVFKSEF